MSDYFAGANGAQGFVNYFPDIFKNESFERIYIIKGGPGTGKSTFMREVADKFAEKCKVERFLCASDPGSLDGVIINGKMKLGIIDGTSPHARECSLPGACEVIFDAGRCFDLRRLSERRGEIEAWGVKKSAAFERAYNYLRCVGAVSELVACEYEGCVDINAIGRKVGELLCGYPSEEDFANEVRVLSAVSMKGIATLDTFKANSSKVYSVYGDSFAAHAFMRVLKNEAARRRISHYFAPSPIYRDVTDAVYLTSSATAFVIGGTGDIDADGFIDTAAMDEKSERIKKVERVADSFIGFALGHLSAARDAHDMLEKIYIEAMDFDALAVMKAAAIAEIEELLYSGNK